MNQRTQGLAALSFLILLAACGGGAPEPESASPAGGSLPAEEETQPTPGPVTEPEAETPAEAAPDFMQLADAAAAAGNWAQARRLYGEAATEDDVPREQYAAAVTKIAMLYLVLPPEPDLEQTQIRLERARNASPRTSRLEVAALQKLLDEIAARDETVRRLTELIGNERE